MQKSPSSPLLLGAVKVLLLLATVGEIALLIYGYREYSSNADFDWDMWRLALLVLLFGSTLLAYWRNRLMGYDANGDPVDDQ